MPDIGFHRANGTKLPILGMSRKGLGQSGDFNGIPQGGACTVSFNVVDGPQIHARLLQRAPDHIRLGLGIGHGIAMGFPPMVNRCSLDHPVDMVPVCHRPGQGL